MRLWMATIAVCLGAQAASAAPLVVTTGTSAPANAVASAAEFTPTGGVILQNNKQGSKKVDYTSYGQTFTAATAFALDSITVMVLDNPNRTDEVGANARGATMGLKVFSYDGATTFVELSSLTGTLPTSLAAGNYLSFKLNDADAVQMSAGSQYAFMLYFADTDAAKLRTLTLAERITGTYAPGRAVQRTLTALSAGQPTPALVAADANRDLTFFVTPVIPEPAAQSMLLVLGAMLLRRR